MQRAGAACLQAMRKRWPLTAHLVVFAGAGNNGGDGYVIAALAKELGITSEVLYLSSPEELAGDASRAYKMAVSAGAEIHPFVEAAFALRGHQPNTLLVDAMLGIGLSRPVSGDYEHAIRSINSSQMPVFAVDVPSGLNADTGEPFDEAISAAQTMTLIAIKQGLLTGSALNFTGDLALTISACLRHSTRMSRRRSPESDGLISTLYSARFLRDHPLPIKGNSGMSWLSVGTEVLGERHDGGGSEFKKRCGSGFCGDAIRAQGRLSGAQARAHGAWYGRP